jgi:hypothetical protein
VQDHRRGNGGYRHGAARRGKAPQTNFLTIYPKSKTGAVHKLYPFPN